MPGKAYVDDGGQALVEFVLIAPILLLLLAGVFQLAVICQAKLLAHMAVRQAVEIHLQGGNQRYMQDEIRDFFDQFPFMTAQSVQVNLRRSPLMTTVSVICQPPAVPYVNRLMEPPVVSASMSLGRELLDSGRLPSISTLRLFQRQLEEVK